MDPYSSESLWLVVTSFLVAFILSFGIGANDVANSFGTSVGAKVLTVRAACILATIFEMAGSLLIGYKVSDTMRKGILDVNVYRGAEQELMLGCLSSLVGSAIWLIVATFLKLPISGTHSIVGATIGFSLVARGTSGLKLQTLATIVASWFISPVLSGIVSVVLYKIIDWFILSSPKPLKPALRALPFIYLVTVAVNIFSIVHDGPKLLYLDNVPLLIALGISIGLGVVTALVVQLVFIPVMQKNRVAEDVEIQNVAVQFTCGDSSESSREGSPTPGQREEDDSRTVAVIIEVPPNNNGYYISQTNYDVPEVQVKQDKKGENELSTKLNVAADRNSIPPSPAIGLTPNSSAVPLIRERPVEQLQIEQGANNEDDPDIKRVFSFLQILTACFGSFAHGGNDVSNAIGPLIAVWLIYIEGSVLQKSETPLFILFFGGIGISIGLWIWGRRVIKTVGEDLTKITPSTGFTIEIGAAFTVLMASKLGLPISTTHCKVGSVVFVGWCSSSSTGVDWSLFRNIISAWVITVPIAGLLSAGFMAAVQPFVL